MQTKRDRFLGQQSTLPATSLPVSLSIYFPHTDSRARISGSRSTFLVAYLSTECDQSARHVRPLSSGDRFFGDSSRETCGFQMERFCAMCGDPTRQQQHFCVSCLVPPVPTLVPLPDLVPSPTPPLDSISRLSPSPSLWKAQTTVPETLTTTPLPHCPQLDTYCSLIERDLNIYGFSVIDNFLPAGDPILTEVVQLYATGHFTAGQVANRKSSPSGIRGDQVVWVKGTEANCTAIGQLMSMFDAIIGRCNARAKGEFGRYQISGRTKAMVACYPGNYAKYVRHVDNPNGDGRCVTCIYYLNKNYVREKHGGVLRIFPEQSDGIVADIEPHFNRAIFFWSDRRNPHEVMPATRLRFAITVWYIDALQRRRKSVEQMGKCATT